MANNLIRQNYLVRSYQDSDRADIRDICVATAWMGDPAPERIGDEWIWAEFWTRYYTDREPCHTWVVERAQDSRIVGYITGTSDVRKVERFTPFLFPGILVRIIRKRLMRRPESRRQLLSMLGSMIRGELGLPRNIGRNFPGTFHFDLLPEIRKLGFGSLLFQSYLRRMEELKLPGIHAQTMSLNNAAIRFFQKNGFRLSDSRTLRTFSHIDKQIIELQTWTKMLVDQPPLTP